MMIGLSSSFWTAVLKDWLMSIMTISTSAPCFWRYLLMVSFLRLGKISSGSFVSPLAMISLYLPFRVSPLYSSMAMTRGSSLLPESPEAGWHRNGARWLKRKHHIAQPLPWIFLLSHCAHGRSGSIPWKSIGSERWRNSVQRTSCRKPHVHSVFFYRKYK